MARTFVTKRHYLHMPLMPLSIFFLILVKNSYVWDSRSTDVREEPHGWGREQACKFLIKTKKILSSPCVENKVISLLEDFEFQEMKPQSNGTHT